jgi:hypothetical protein
MLVTCPDCGREVSDRAHACPGCGFPIAEQLAERAKETLAIADRSSRQQAGEVDCGNCKARGFRPFTVHEENGETSECFDWCRVCEHTGRVLLGKSTRGFFAVASRHLDAFLAGTRDDVDEFIVFLGTAEPPPHRYPQAGTRVIDDE